MCKNTILEMRESKFVQQNRENWTEFEAALQNNSKDPESLYKLFTQVTEDLSYSRTFYKNRSVRNYLNALAQQSFFKIYKSVHLSKWKSFKQFWVKDLPLSVWQSRKSILLSFVFFAVAVVIGALSTRQSLDFAQLILGEAYIQKTLENISKGDPMGIYKDADMFGMTLGITVNNILVSFFAYLLGILWGVGTFVLILRNGIMLGCFQYFFYEKGLLKEMLLTIWLHGTLEISAIIIAGGAGFELAKGLVMPGTFTRIQAFRASAQKGLTIMVGLVPVFMMAGFIEGFITRHTEMFWGIKLALILVSLAFVLFYYVYYPYFVHKNNPVELEDYHPNPVAKHEIVLNQFKNTRQLIAETFIIYGKNLTKNVITAILWSLPYVAIIFYFLLQKDGEIDDHLRLNSTTSSLSLLIDSFKHSFILLVLAASISLMITFWANNEHLIGNKLVTFLKNFAILTVLLLLFTSEFMTLGVIAFILFLPVLFFLKTFLENENGVLGNLFSYGFKYLGQSVLYTGLQYTLVIMTLGYGIYLLLDYFVWEMINTVVSWHLNDNYFYKEMILDSIHYFIIGSIFLILWQIYSIGVNLWYHSSLEIHEANGLKNVINNWKLDVDKK